MGGSSAKNTSAIDLFGKRGVDGLVTHTEKTLTELQ